MAMSGPWNYNGQPEPETQPLNMALLLLQQELAELGSSGAQNKQQIPVPREAEQSGECPPKHNETADVYIKEEPHAYPHMNYPYPMMPCNFNMGPQMWPLPQPPQHLHRVDQSLPEYAEKTILNLDDIKEEILTVRCSPSDAYPSQTQKCEKCNGNSQSPEHICRNDMYSRRMHPMENSYNYQPMQHHPGPSWYGMKTFTGKETMNRWDFHAAENMRNYTNSFMERHGNMHGISPLPMGGSAGGTGGGNTNGNDMNGSEEAVNGCDQEEVLVYGPMAHPDSIPMCRVCGKGFSYKEQLLSHMVVHRSRKPHVCEICEKSFSSPGNLKTHIMIHTGQKPHACEKCGKRFTTLGNLKTHAVVHTAEKPHPCQVCGKGFTTLGNLKTHLLIHTGERPYVCEVCGKRFTTRGNVKAHSVTHTAEKPFVCHICGKNFSHKGNLKTHIVSRHMTPKPQFDCNICGRSFAQAETLNTHIAMMHANSNDTANLPSHFPPPLRPASPAVHNE